MTMVVCGCSQMFEGKGGGKSNLFLCLYLHDEPRSKEASSSMWSSLETLIQIQADSSSNLLSS